MNWCLDEDELAGLDVLTSSIIRRGGTLNTNSRSNLDKISPFLAKRMTGYGNMPLQEAMKQTFDPNDVLMSDAMFSIRNNKSKSMLQNAREKNKQVNYLL